MIVFATVLAIGAYLAPYVVAFILTRFETQQSTLLQRVWIVSWLVVGQICGLPGLWFRPILSFRYWKVMSLIVGIGVVPGIGVWFFVAKMIMEGGICKIM